MELTNPSTATTRKPTGTTGVEKNCTPAEESPVSEKPPFHTFEGVDITKKLDFDLCIQFASDSIHGIINWKPA